MKTMEPSDLVVLVEALLFAADQPLTAQQIAKVVDDEAVKTPDVQAAVDALARRYDDEERGFQLLRFGNGHQIVTRERFAPWVETLVAGTQKARLSRAALETAAVIGYKQPITRMEIERIRGVDVGGVLQTLVERNLVMIKGRDPGPGRPLLYGTTQEFLDYFGLSRLSDLPQLDEIAALARAEASTVWTEDERSRFEKHGVEPDSVPPPIEPEPVEGGPRDEEPLEAESPAREPAPPA
jgi:segregation and condensation protein B